MTEPDVALTDYAVTLEGIIFFVILQRYASPSRLRSWFMLLFAGMALATFCGGTVHGFFLEDALLGHRILWLVTLLSVGVTTLASWAIGAELLFSPRVARAVIALACLQAVVYSLAAIFYTREFWIAMIDNLPAILFLLVALLVTFVRQRQGSVLWAAVGLGLTIVASVLQQRKVGIHADYFNHNALYHVLLAVALFLMFWGARRLVGLAGNDADALAQVPGPAVLPQKAGSH